VKKLRFNAGDIAGIAIASNGSVFAKVVVRIVACGPPLKSPAGHQVDYWAVDANDGSYEYWLKDEEICKLVVKAGTENDGLPHTWE
jgi:hypothetical protein